MKNKFGKYSDRKLVRIISSDKASVDGAFTELYNRYENKIFRYCRYMTGDRDTAEDIMQETFIKFYKSVKNGINEENIGGYLITISRNLCLNYIRSKKVRTALEINELTDQRFNKYENDELINLIETALELLDVKYKEAFILREMNGISYNEIGEICGISPSGAQTRACRAKEQVIKILKPYIQDLANK